MTADRVGAFEADIAASPTALARLLDAWDPPDLGGRRRFVFTGLGSSRSAALIVATSLRAAGTSAWVEYASTASPTSPADDLVMVAISASGGTREVLEAVGRHQGRSLVVAVTNRPDAPLAACADLVLSLHAGEEIAGIACRSFRAMIAAIALLTGAATVDDLRPAVEALTARLATADAWCPPLVNALDGAPSIDVLADASMLGVAEQAALMLREAPRLPARAYDTADWLHTGVYLALPGHRALLFPGTPADDEVRATIERRGGLVATVDALAPAVRHSIGGAIADSLVTELVAATLWARTTADDRAT